MTERPEGGDETYHRRMDRAGQDEEFAKLRSRCPISEIAPGAHLLVRYVDVVAVLRDGGTYRSLDDPAIPPAAVAQWTTDPAEHQRRRLPLFAAHRLAIHRRELADVCARLVAGAERAGGCDAITEVIDPITYVAIARLLGIADSDRECVFGWVEQMGTSLGPTDTAPDLRPESAWQAGATPLRRWLVDEVDRRGSLPVAEQPDDGLGLLLRSDPVSGRVVAHDELLGYVYLLCRSGVGPLRRLLVNLVRHVADHPALLDAVRAGELEATTVVERVLADDPPIQFLMRNPVTDVDIHGVGMAAGSRLVMSVRSANTEVPLRHLAFGRGEHFCPAASLGRLVAAELLKALAVSLCRIALRDEADLASLTAPSVWTPAAMPIAVSGRTQP